MYTRHGPVARTAAGIRSRIVGPAAGNRAPEDGRSERNAADGRERRGHPLSIGGWRRQVCGVTHSAANVSAGIRSPGPEARCELSAGLMDMNRPVGVVTAVRPTGRGGASGWPRRNDVPDERRARVDAQGWSLEELRAAVIAPRCHWRRKRPAAHRRHSMCDCGLWSDTAFAIGAWRSPVGHGVGDCWAVACRPCDQRVCVTADYRVSGIRRRGSSRRRTLLRRRDCGRAVRRVMNRRAIRTIARRDVLASSGRLGWSSAVFRRVRRRRIVSSTNRCADPLGIDDACGVVWANGIDRTAARGRACGRLTNGITLRASRSKFRRVGMRRPWPRHRTRRV